RYKQKIRIRGIMGLAAVGPAVLRRCWPRQSSTWCVSEMLQVSSLRKSYRMLGMSAHWHLSTVPYTKSFMWRISLDWS
ncbi:hypothetical protein Tco_0578198, partial [Tanacetum coccineum]